MKNIMSPSIKPPRFLARILPIAMACLLLIPVAHAGFNRNVTVVSDDATQHQAFVDCNNVVIRRTVAKQTANWGWQLAIYDGDRDGLINDVVFIGSRSKHIVGPHIGENANNLVSVDLDAICDNAAGQAARVPQHSQRSTIHAPLGHEDFVQIRADAVPGGGVGVRISIQLNHLDQQSPVPLDTPFLAPPDEESGVGEDGEQEEGGSSESSEDCNDNGLADELDIAIGVDGDADANGIPNGCQISAQPARLSTAWGTLIALLLIVAVAVLAMRRRKP